MLSHENASEKTDTKLINYFLRLSACYAGKIWRKITTTQHFNSCKSHSLNTIFFTGNTVLPFLDIKVVGGEVLKDKRCSEYSQQMKGGEAEEVT